jgi:hypothetical protein
VAGADPKIQIDITARDKASDAIDHVADEADKLEKKSPELEVTADTASAMADLKAVDETAGRISHDDTVLVIRAQIDKAKGDLKAFEAQLHDTEAAGRSVGDGVQAGADRSHSALGGFEADTGKAAGASRSLSGAVVGDSLAAATGMGALGESVSQVTEGLLEGEVAMGSLLKAGLSMGAITVVVSQITKALEANKAIDAFNRKKVDEFTAALKGAKDEAELFTKVLLKDDRLDFVDAADGKTKDLTGHLADAGITWETFIGQVAKGKDSFREWVIANGEAIGAGAGLNAVIQAGNQFIDDRAAAQKAYNDVQFVSGAQTAETSRETERLNHAYVDGSAALQGLKGDSHAATVQIDRFAESTAEADQNYRRLTGRLDESEAWDTVNAAIAEFGKQSKHSAEDTRNLTRDIADYVASTATIPPEKKTTILTLLEQGDIAAAEAALAELTRQREIFIKLTGPGAAAASRFTPGGVGPQSIAPAPPVAAPTITVNLPRGARSSDIARALGVNTRRNGRRYQAVTGARR